MVELSPAQPVPDLLRFKSVSAPHAKNISGTKICSKWRSPNSRLTLTNERSHLKLYLQSILSRIFN